MRNKKRGDMKRITEKRVETEREGGEKKENSRRENKSTYCPFLHVSVTSHENGKKNVRGLLNKSGIKFTTRIIHPSLASFNTQSRSLFHTDLPRMCNAHSYHVLYMALEEHWQMQTITRSKYQPTDCDAIRFQICATSSVGGGGGGG
jgi:hypothetical protein